MLADHKRQLIYLVKATHVAASDLTSLAIAQLNTNVHKDNTKLSLSGRLAVAGKVLELRQLDAFSLRREAMSTIIALCLQLITVRWLPVCDLSENTVRGHTLDVNAVEYSHPRRASTRDIGGPQHSDFVSDKLFVALAQAPRKSNVCRLLRA